MNIGIIIGRIGGVDGVALETEKWIEVFKRLGHNVFIVSGEFQNWDINPEKDTLVPEMSFFNQSCMWDQENAFFEPDEPTIELLYHIDNYSNIIYRQLEKWLHKNKIDVVLSENASALPAHLSMGLAIKKLAERTGVKTITHDHDFAWERGDRYISPHNEINDFIAETFPLRCNNSIHAVINTHGQESIMQKFGRKAIIVPNVMDFDQEFGVLSKSNGSLRNELKLDKSDILLFQITRIVRRKGIETAIKLVDKLQDKRIKLIITGSHADDEGSIYYNELNALINDLKLDNQVKFAAHIINNKGNLGGLGITYSLSDAYANANSCTYFSTYEGFGNAFVEAVLAKKPIFVNNYQPVYMPDIGSKGFKTVMLENSNLTDESVKNMAEIIYNPELNKEIGEYNWKLGKKYFSYDTLQEKIEEILKSF
ncbi:MAG: glycosyltransferase family 4 protein [Bacteroidales bacterium]|nr:glycosyltransferase family 4 protein [Bacteroidales bacterium]MBN2756393.1 glycosyltransferase family 4 protein [Bacteroidales bacterium]